MQSVIRSLRFGSACSELPCDYYNEDMNVEYLNQLGTNSNYYNKIASEETLDANYGSWSEPNWQWPCFVRFKRRGQWVTEKATQKDVTINDEGAKWPFEVVRFIEGEEREVVVLRSSSLIQVLKKCAPHTGLNDLNEGCEVNSKEIFLRRQGLQAYLVEHHNGDADADPDPTAQAVKHLLRFVEAEFATTLVQYERMTRDGCVSHDMLWAFLVPGEKVCRRCLISNQDCFATVKRLPSYTCSISGAFCTLELNIMEFDGERYYKCSMHYTIRSFDGEQPFTSLRVCPLRFFPDPKQMEAYFISRGNRFYTVAMEKPPQFMQFKGSLAFLSEKTMALIKKNADGRAAIDFMNFARMNPNYPLNNAEQRRQRQPGRTQMSSEPTDHGMKKKPSDEELKFAPAIVYGFSFRLKRWGCFDLEGLREITFNVGAFDALRMKDESQKAILWSVVQHYVTKPSPATSNHEKLSINCTPDNIDPIANKGAGCIVLCHGPPGTGKTLTAEALAESMKCPLWSISAFELGTEPDEVEGRLSEIMEVAHTWKAVLLLDEADTYLERRDKGVDVKRNMLTGVFLRMLEYYQGIMFLTTNRVVAFDDAILSRTTLAICYPALDDTQRVQIWTEMLSRAGMNNTTLGLVNSHDSPLLWHPLNGRQIRSVVNLARLLALGRKQSLDMEHVLEAVEVFIAGTRELPSSSKG